MIGDWLAAAPALLAALAVVFLPGLAVGYGLRLRGLALWALAPVGTTAVLPVLAIAYAWMGVGWTVLTAGIGCLVLAVAAWFAGRALGTPGGWSTRSGGRGLLAAGLSIGIALGVTRFVLYVVEPGAISQTNDATFHLNALRYVAETGSASSFDISAVTGGRGFYPGAWHAIAALIAQASGGAIPVAANMLTLVVSVAIWPLAITWLTREATAGDAAATATAAALSPALLAFPMLMVQWGILYPYGLSVALLPAAVALVVAAPRWIAGDGPVAARGPAIGLLAVLLLAALAALALSQPATLLAWAILAVSFATWWLARRLGGAEERRRRALVGSMIAIWVLFAGLWFVLTRATTGSHWPPFRGKLIVFVDLLLNGQVLLPASIAVSAAMVVGLVVAVRKPELRWLATGWLVFGGLYILTAAIGQPFLRRWLLGAWYADPYRIAALAPVVVIPLAAIGLVAVVAWVIGRIRRPTVAHATGWWALGATAVGGILSLALQPVVQMPQVTQDVSDEQSRYVENADSWLSPDERAILESLDEVVATGERVIGNPSTGTAFGYALSGVDVFPRTWSHPRTDAWQVLQAGLRDAGTDPAVCEALAVYGDPGYVLDFGLGESTPGRFVLPGMTGFEGRPGFELVVEHGDASLWRITACG